MRRFLWGTLALLLLVSCGTESIQPTTNSAGLESATATNPAPATAAPTTAPATSAPTKAVPTMAPATATNPAPATAAPTTAPATPAPTKAAPTTAPATPAPTVVATLETTGGIAGVMQRFVVWSDGKLELSSDSSTAPIRLGQASPAQIQALIAAVNRPEFKALGASYLPKDTCCDFFTYVLSTDDLTVTTMDGVDWPEPLRTALSLVLELQGLATTSP